LFLLRLLFIQTSSSGVRRDAQCNGIAGDPSGVRDISVGRTTPQTLAGIDSEVSRNTADRPTVARYRPDVALCNIGLIQ
jgi:hypothetical protein